MWGTYTQNNAQMDSKKYNKSQCYLCAFCVSSAHSKKCGGLGCGRSTDIPQLLWVEKTNVSSMFDTHGPLRGHGEAWDSITPAPRATQICGFMSPYPQLKGHIKLVGFESVAKLWCYEHLVVERPGRPHPDSWVP